MWRILSQPQPCWRNEYGPQCVVQYDTFSMMYSSCLLSLNLRRKGLKPNTSVKSMNHPLFIFFNWKKEAEKKTVLHRWDVWSLFLFFFITTRWKNKKKQNTKVSLFLSTHLSLWLWENRIGGETWSETGRNQSGTPYTTARSHGSRKCPTPLPSSSSPLSSVHHSLPLSFPAFPVPSPSPQHHHPPNHLPSPPSSPPPRHLPALTPDTALPLRFQPFLAQPVCCGGAVVVSDCTFFPLLSSLRPLLCTWASEKWISPSACSLSAVCVWERVCGWVEQRYHIMLNMPNDD